MCGDEVACAVPQSGVQSKAKKVWHFASAGILIAGEVEDGMWTTEHHRRTLPQLTHVDVICQLSAVRMHVPMCA